MCEARITLTLRATNSPHLLGIEMGFSRIGTFSVVTRNSSDYCNELITLLPPKPDKEIIRMEKNRPC